MNYFYVKVSCDSSNMSHLTATGKANLLIYKNTNKKLVKMSN